MEENMTAWKERRTGPDAPNAMPGGGSTAGVSSEAKQTPVIPLGPGEWEDGLGVPISVVCMNANKIERMEREFGWQEEQFDFVLQWMRCVLLKRKSGPFQYIWARVLTAALRRRWFPYLHNKLRHEQRPSFDSFKSKYTLTAEARSRQA